MIKSPFGIAVAAVVLILSFSPRAREIARQYAVLGTEKLLDLTDQVRSSAARVNDPFRLENDNHS